MRSSTDAVEGRLLAKLERRPLAEQLDLVHEIVWRREVMLDPLTEPLRSAARSILARAVHLIANAGHDSALDINALSTVACALVTDARLQMNETAFLDSLGSATELADQSPDVAQRLHHEKSLWALFAMDLETLGKELDAWDTSNQDPFWSVRKTAIAFEAGFTQDPRSVLDSALDALRLAKGQTRSVAVATREAWALHFTHALEIAPWINTDWAYRSTLRELARFKCDPIEELRQVALAVRPPPPRATAPGFDLGTESRSTPISFYSGRSPDESRKRASYRAVRLAEAAGLPPTAGNWGLTLHVLRDAATALHSAGQVELSLRLMLRVTSYDGDDLVKTLLARTNLAKMEQAVVDGLALTCESLIDYCRANQNATVAQGIMAPVERMRVAIECLSRLVLRLDATRAEQVFQRSLQHYADAASLMTHAWLRVPSVHLMQRSWSALPDASKIKFALDVLGAPIVGFDGFDVEEYGWPDPADLLESLDAPLPERGGEVEQHWRETVQYLIRAVSVGAEETRSRAMVRLVHIALGDRVASTETAGIASAIWDRADDAGVTSLPGASRLRNWLFLCVPEPGPGIANAWFRKTWLEDTATETREQELDAAVFHLGDALESHHTHRFQLPISDDDSRQISSLLTRWSELPIPNRTFLLPFDYEGRHRAQNAVRGLAALLVYLDLDQDVADSVCERALKLEQLGIGAAQLLVTRAPLLGGGQDDAAAEVRKRIWSNDVDVVHDIINAIAFWLRWASRGHLPQPSSEIVREIGVVVANRRSIALVPALRVSTWIFAEGEEYQRDELLRLVIEGLGFLLHELDYSQENSAEEEDIDIPYRRWGVVGLVHAMRGRGIQHPVVDNWLERIMADPLPEVRNSPTRVRF